MTSLSRFFEPLEDRRVLAAASYVSTGVSQTDWTLVVRYTDPQGINTATLGNNDIRVTGPGGYDKLGVFQSFVQDTVGSNASIRAVYKVPAQGTAWDFSDNGNYSLFTVAGGVTDTGGEQMPGVFLRGFPLWFTTPKAEVISSFTTGDQLVVNVRYSDNAGIDAATIGFGELGLRRNSDPNNVTFVRSQTFFQNTAASWTVTYRLPAVGGTWDYTDSGAYTLIMNGNQVRDLDSPSNAIPAQTLSTYNLFFSNPKAEYVSTSLSGTDWIVRVRYHDSNGINASTIGNGDLFVTNGFVTVQGTLLAPPTQEGINSVLASYRVWDGFGFGAADTGAWRLTTNTNAVTDNTGVGVNRGTFHTFGLWFDQPSISRPPSASGFNGTTWTVDVTYTDNAGINFSSVGNGDLLAVGPNGYWSPATLVSKTTRIDSRGRTVVDARYAFARPLVTGTYTISTRPNQVLDNGGRPVTSFNWKSYTIIA
jgi:hypothetical protein